MRLLHLLVWVAIVAGCAGQAVQATDIQLSAINPFVDLERRRQVLQD